MGEAVGEPDPDAGCLQRQRPDHRADGRDLPAWDAWRAGYRPPTDSRRRALLAGGRRRRAGQPHRGILAPLSAPRATGAVCRGRQNVRMTTAPPQPTEPAEKAESQQLLRQLLDPANRADPYRLYAQLRARRPFPMREG